MAISFTLNSSSSGGRTVSITLPATVSAGDLLIAAQYDITNEAIPSTPSGWTLINSITSGATSGTLGIIAKIADGTEGGTTVSWFPGSDDTYAALSLTPDTTLSSLGSVTGTDAETSTVAISLNGTPSAGTLPLMLIYAGGSNGEVDVAPNGEFTESFFGLDGVELNATFYDVGDSTANVTVTTGDTGRQTLVLGNLNLNFVASVSVVVDVTGAAGTGSVGSAAATGGASTTATGSEGTGQVGEATTQVNQSVLVDGLEAAAASGDVTVNIVNVVVFFDGWGRSTWGQGAWSQPIALPLEATGQVGEVTARAGAQVPVNGFSMAGAVGAVTVTGGTGVDVPVTGVSAVGLISPWGVLVWGRIVPDPDTEWLELAPSPSADWTPIAPNPATVYTDIQP